MSNLQEINDLYLLSLLFSVGMVLSLYVSLKKHSCFSCFNCCVNIR